jgi:transposase
MLTPEERTELDRLVQDHIPLRAIARRLGRDVKTIRRALGRPPQPRPPAKLAPYQALVTERFAQGLRAPRILRDLRERGYPGGLTILKDFLRTLGPRRPARRAFHRFETGPGEEAQADWSPYRVVIADRETVAHAFAMVLCYSRRSYVGFFRDERLPTLLWAHQEAFAYHAGLCRRIAYDNQTAITLGRVGGQPRWHPTFLAFARHYAFEPAVGRPGHPERRGKVERPFAYLEADFLCGRSFASWDDLNGQGRAWLDSVANVRVHGTTRRRIDEAYAEERPCLIALPPVAYPAARQETRTVQKEGAVPIDGSYYPVPGARPGQQVHVRIDPVRVQVLDAAGAVVATHPVPEQPMRLPTPAPPPGQPATARTRPGQEARFLARFPDAAAFLDGLTRRMTTLTPIHLHALEQLAALYGEAAVGEALAVATAYRNFNARAIERILRRADPTVVPEPAVATLAPRPAALGALDDVDPGSPRDYTLDSMDPTGGPDDGA